MSLTKRNLDDFLLAQLNQGGDEMDYEEVESIDWPSPEELAQDAENE